MTRGERLFRIVQQVDPSVENTLPVRMRSTGRLIEEVTELCLASGMGAVDVVGHVMDAIHNECRKAKVYPSELNADHIDRAEIVVELADASLLIEYLCSLNDVSLSLLDQAKEDKLAKLNRQAVAGEMIVINGLLYRANARGPGTA